MTCPVCNGPTGVVDSRPNDESVRRRRRCFDCGHEFRTIELDEDLLAKEKPKERPVVLHFSVKYDPATGMLRLINGKEGKA